MSPDTVVTVANEAMKTLLLVSAPVMLVALVVGLLISLFQALTSIQEATLTFVPKIIAVFVVLVVAMPFMASELDQFTTDLFARMAEVDVNTAPGTAQP
jgi:flagellar biosynthetic protein FliQ